MPRWTSGKWIVQEAGNAILAYDTDGKCLGTIAYGESHWLPGSSEDEARANLTLMVSSPELVTRLLKLMEAAAPHLPDDDPALQGAREIIAHLVGEFMK